MMICAYTPHSDSELNDGTFHNLTICLILVPIGTPPLHACLLSHRAHTSYLAAGLSGLAFLFGLCGASYHRAGTVFMTLLSSLAFIVTLVVWVIEMALFGIARSHVRDRGAYAEYANANWLVLGALVALFLAFFASLCGTFGSYRSRRAVY